ncbi:hypothetical protein BJV78DRAFT_1278496 [Lactifluus subvellereus]|nr:hypothetical protein BJV78DRAFT_1278496 [Lactifluus subvellereus]
MTIKLEIHPLSSSLDLLGPPDSSSAYSLSGHVSISLTSSRSLFERRRAVRILLRSLVITFEGQAELVSQESSYAAVRLCTISKELVSKTTVELSNEGHEDGDEPCTWHVMFDLPIPGWLPASDTYGDCRHGLAGTQYNLYATVKFANVEDAHYAGGPSWLSTLCNPFTTKNKIVNAAACRMYLNRFALPPRGESFRPSSYSIKASGQPLPSEAHPHPIPADIVSKIELLASVPQCVSMDGDKFPFSLNMRTSSLSESQAAKLRVSHMSLELQQTDQYSASASAYAASYPVPHQREQPPHKALRTAHPVGSLYDIGLLGTPVQFTFDDVHSLLPGCGGVGISLEKGDHARKCAEGMHPTRWFTMEIDVPLARKLPRRQDETLEWTGAPRLRASSQGPLFSVRHSMRATVTLVYDGADAGETVPVATSTLSFTLPLNLVRLRGAPHNCVGAAYSQPPSAPGCPLSPDASALPAVAMPPTHPYHIPELPAYSQLFYPNGDVKHDDSIPLPLYTLSPSPSPPTPTLSDVSEEDEHLTSEISCLLPDSSPSNVHGDIGAAL